MQVKAFDQAQDSAAYYCFCHWLLSSSWQNHALVAKAQIWHTHLKATESQTEPSLSYVVT